MKKMLSIKFTDCLQVPWQKIWLSLEHCVSEESNPSRKKIKSLKSVN